MENLGSFLLRLGKLYIAFRNGLDDVITRIMKQDLKDLILLLRGDKHAARLAIAALIEEISL